MAEPKTSSTDIAAPTAPLAPGVFSYEEYQADRRRVVAYAEATGQAAVVRPNGEVYVVITIGKVGDDPLEVD